MLNVVAPEVLSNNPYDISWPEVPKGQPKCFIMNYFGKVMPRSHWITERVMLDFADDPYFTKEAIMMYDLGTVLPNGIYKRDPMRHNVTAIRVLSFGNEEEDSVRALFLHDEMLREDSKRLLEEEVNRRKYSIASRAAALSTALSFSEASEIIDSSRPMNVRGQLDEGGELF